MKRLIDAIRNIWNIEELRNKILFTLLFLLIYRWGTHIALPFIDSEKLEINIDSGGVLGLLNIFAGGAFSQASIFALGIMPYISASIFMQLATVVVPSLQKMQKSGESGRTKISQWTRYLTVIVTVFQASAYVAYLRQVSGGAIVQEYLPYFWVTTTFVLTAGTLFVMWLGEKITEKGLGNGTSLIIMIGIIAQFPSSIIQEFQSKGGTNGGMVIFFIEIVAFIVVILFSVLVINGVRRVPLSYARQIVGARLSSSSVSATNARQFLPLRLNSSGVMPIIFAQAIMFFPELFSFGGSTDAKGFWANLSDMSSYTHMGVYAAVVLLFTFIYTALVFNPKQIAEDLKHNNGFIPGIPPGKATAEYIGRITDRITLPGGIFLALIGILPGFAMRFGITQGFALFYGGTSLLIAVGVILDTMQQIETYLLLNKYDGMMQGTRKGPAVSSGM